MITNIVKSFDVDIDDEQLQRMNSFNQCTDVKTRDNLFLDVNQTVLSQVADAESLQSLGSFLPSLADH